MAPRPVRTRLSDVDDAADMAAQLLKRGDLADSLNAAVVHRIGAKLAARVGTGKRRALRTRWKWALVIVLVGPFALAAVSRWLPEREPEAVEKQLPARGQPPASHFDLSTVEEPQPSSAVLQTKPATQRSLGMQRKMVLPPKEDARPRVAEPVAESQLTIEARLMTLALEQLRTKKNAAEALNTLDEYLERFPRGTFIHEAALARIDALWSLNRRREVLDALDGVDAEDFSGTPRQDELRLWRGELLAEFGDCIAASKVFAAFTHEPVNSALHERAIFWSAFCLAKQGDEPASRLALERYLTLFPHGRFFRQAQNALDGL